MKPLMPVPFDPDRIISLDGVDNVGFLGKLDREFTLTTTDRIRTTNLVEPASLHQIDEAGHSLRGRSRLGVVGVICGLSGKGTEGR